MKKTLTASLIAATLALGACSSDDDDDNDVDGGATAGEPTTYQITFTNVSNQLVTPPVVAIHDTSVHLFQIGEEASDEVQAIAEMGDNTPLVELAGTLGDAISGAGVAGDGPFGPGGTATISLTTDQPEHVFSAVNMVICTNDGIAGFDSISLPTGTDPLVQTAVVYDAGTRVNGADSNSYFPPPCRATGVDSNGDLILTDLAEAALEDPRGVIGPHAGQTGITQATAGPANGLSFDFDSGASIIQVEIVRN
jgi:hypothetical protein